MKHNERIGIYSFPIGNIILVVISGSLLSRSSLPLSVVTWGGKIEITCFGKFVLPNAHLSFPRPTCLTVETLEPHRGSFFKSSLPSKLFHIMCLPKAYIVAFFNGGMTEAILRWESECCCWYGQDIFHLTIHICVYWFPSGNKEEISPEVLFVWFLVQLRESTTSDSSLEMKEHVFCFSLRNFFRCELCIVQGLFLKNIVIFEILSLTSLKVSDLCLLSIGKKDERFTNHVFHGPMAFGFYSVLVPIAADLKVLEFVCVLDLAAQIIPFRCVKIDILSTALLSSDSRAHGWNIRSAKTSLYFEMVVSRGDLCSTSVASVVFNAYISLHVLLLWRFHIAGEYVELSSAREHRLWHRQHAAHIALLWFGLEAVIGFFDNSIIIRVIPEVLLSRHHHILLLLQRAVMFLDGLECDLDLNWWILFVQHSMVEERFLCDDAVIGRRMWECGVLMALRDEKGKTKYLWPPWVSELFVVLLQTFSIELHFGFFHWRVGDVSHRAGVLFQVTLMWFLVGGTAYVSKKTLFGRSSAASSGPNIGKSAGFAFANGSPSRSSLRRLTSSRVPVELSAGVSLIPLHSVTASALLTSLLPLSNQIWGCLSEAEGYYKNAKYVSKFRKSMKQQNVLEKDEMKQQSFHGEGETGESSKLVDDNDKRKAKRFLANAQDLDPSTAGYSY
ncbi:hypothetical protein Bca52824_033182 [Brassica carinata]|uniref:Uncharacterized protein n=1 Tax=Brassica carinata TaxID=52824 RepID=A0A8X7V891_BRACI|nr:hypothetical protein Bca52824_033182 [Brassica carinata]